MMNSTNDPYWGATIESVNIDEAVRLAEDLGLRNENMRETFDLINEADPHENETQLTVDEFDEILSRMQTTTAEHQDGQQEQHISNLENFGEATDENVSNESFSNDAVEVVNETVSTVGRVLQLILTLLAIVNALIEPFETVEEEINQEIIDDQEENVPTITLREFVEGFVDSNDEQDQPITTSENSTNTSSPELNSTDMSYEPSTSTGIQLGSNSQSVSDHSTLKKRKLTSPEVNSTDMAHESSTSTGIQLGSNSQSVSHHSTSKKIKLTSSQPLTSSANISSSSPELNTTNMSTQPSTSTGMKLRSHSKFISKHSTLKKRKFTATHPITTSANSTNTSSLSSSLNTTDMSHEPSTSTGIQLRLFTQPSPCTSPQPSTSQPISTKSRGRGRPEKTESERQADLEGISGDELLRKKNNNACAKSRRNKKTKLMIAEEMELKEGKRLKRLKKIYKLNKKEIQKIKEKLKAFFMSRNQRTNEQP